MSSFAAWGLTILGLALITTVAEMLLPQGKTRKVIRSVFATVTVFAIITPLPSFFKHGFDFDFSADTVVTDADYLEYVDKSRARMLERAVTEYLISKGHTAGYAVRVETDGYSVKSVSVEFDEIGMTGNGEHINKSEIVKLIADYFDVGEEAVMSYG